MGKLRSFLEWKEVGKLTTCMIQASAALYEKMDLNGEDLTFKSYPALTSVEWAMKRCFKWFNRNATAPSLLRKGGLRTAGRHPCSKNWQGGRELLDSQRSSSNTDRSLTPWWSLNPISLELHGSQCGSNICFGELKGKALLDHAQGLFCMYVRFWIPDLSCPSPGVLWDGVIVSLYRR